MKLLLKLLLISMVIVFAIGLLSGTEDHSVLTEAGRAKEARYQEWKIQENENRAREGEQERFQKRYDNEKYRSAFRGVR